MLVTGCHDVAHRTPAINRVLNRKARAQHGWPEGVSMSASVLEATQAKVLDAAAVKWAPHPKFKGVEIAYLLSKKEDGIDVTYALVRWHVGAEIPRHIHEDSDDILYIIQGKATIWIDQVGDVPLSAGSFVRVPKGVLHQPHDVEEELIAQDLWFPATV
jgi:mannose-6-phosphate isomerase-like protein (cupin superfamily)